MGTADQPPMDEKMAACLAAGELAEEHKHLAVFEGTFRSVVRMWWEPGAEPHESTGVMVSRPALGGRFLEQEYHDDGGMFSGRGYFGYNTIKARWEGFWIDTMTTSMQFETGTASDDFTRWEMRSEATEPGTGRLVRRRSVVTISGPDEHTMEMYLSYPADGDAEQRSMEIRYTRA